MRGVESVDPEGRVRVAQKHENIPNAELRRERNGVIEKGEVPPGAIRRGHDVQTCLSNPTILALEAMLCMGYCN